MSLESVIDRFGTFARKIYAPPAGPEVPFPFQLEGVRATIEHHLVPLTMIGRSDHELLRAERDVIVDHCRALMRQKDKLLSASEIEALEGYIDRYAPSAAQLEAALRKIGAAGQDEFASLLAAADRVILADDTVRPEEQAQLTEIKKLLEELRGK